jgi:ABC-type branched-subunit amino acid transport system ATPase component
LERPNDAIVTRALQHDSQSSSTTGAASGAETPARLVVDSVTAGYRSQPIIFDVSVRVPAGSVVAIIGPNGAGKSTLFKALFGVARLMSGSVIVDGARVTPSARALVRRGIVYVPQLRNVFPSLTVKENLEIGTFVRTRGNLSDRVFGLFPDLRDIQGKRAGKLSGGQRNMLAVGRALMSDPEVILLDEATGGLSPLVAQNLWLHLRQIASAGIAIAAIEQNVHMALGASDYVYVLAGGRNLLSGTPADLARTPHFGQMFLEGAES